MIDHSWQVINKKNSCRNALIPFCFVFNALQAVLFFVLITQQLSCHARFLPTLFYFTLIRAFTFNQNQNISSPLDRPSKLATDLFLKTCFAIRWAMPNRCHGQRRLTQPGLQAFWLNSSVTQATTNHSHSIVAKKRAQVCPYKHTSQQVDPRQNQKSPRKPKTRRPYGVTSHKVQPMEIHMKA